MRRTSIASALVLALAGAAQAQPTGYYPGRGADYAYRYEPPKVYGYDGSYTPYSYGNGYDGYNGGDWSVAAGLGGALLGATMSPDILRHAPYDRFGPDPNGMVGPDGRQIKCKLVNRYDSYRGQFMTRRECW
jgi:hypothetical protein